MKNNDCIKSVKHSFSWGETSTIANRRIMHQRETSLDASAFSQTVDVDLDLADGQRRPIPDMDGYYIRSADQAIAYTRELMKLGVGSVTYRLGGGLKTKGEGPYIYAPLLLGAGGTSATISSASALVSRHAEFYAELRREFAKGSLYIIADHFGLAPNLSDGAWGERDADGRLDFDATAELLQTLAVAYVGSGADAVLTMGRVEHEVELTRSALERAGLEGEILAFAQNIESKAAYVYLDKLGKADSFQKILPGNLTEMKIRTVTDLYEGASSIIVKPSDNLHILQFTADIISNPAVAIEMIQRIIDSNILRNRPDFVSRLHTILDDRAKLARNARNARVGTYTVSGSYFVDRLLLQAKGDKCLFHVQDERFRNIDSVIKDARSYIIDRSAEWYLRHLAKESAAVGTDRRPESISGHFDVV